MAAELDIVVLGATGITGRGVVGYLRTRAPGLGLRWAVAGRDSERLSALLGEAEAEAEVLHVDVTDDDTIRAAAERTSVIANVAGPYARYGAPVYRVCIETGTHHVDACAEIDWLRDRIDDLHDTARSAGVCLVAAAGFESLPFDLVTLLAAETIRERTGDMLADIDIAATVDRDPPLGRPVDFVSGGTLTSGLDALRAGTQAATTDARLLDPRPHEPLQPDIAPRRHGATGDWLGPLSPSPFINPAIVHRSAGLLDSGQRGFAPDFRYRDGLVTTDLLPGLPAAVTAGWLSGAQAALSMVAASPPAVRDMVADVMQAFGPRPGEGPDPARLDAWSWRLDASATATVGTRLDLVVEGDGHPGYRSTPNLIGEAALLMAEPGRDLPAGIVTPAVALGTASLERLEAAGMRATIG